MNKTAIWIIGISKRAGKDFVKNLESIGKRPYFREKFGRMELIRFKMEINDIYNLYPVEYVNLPTTNYQLPGIIILLFI